ncbi:MAG: 30S ribosomal protein S4 [Nanohaloarchaea archaeon]|nr:30S ribosomal protein S4 [Candidatus Nanohaloarchaea archaeon]
MVKKLKQQYETPNEGWSEERINKEDQLLEEYGLKNKREVYKAESKLRGFRREARKLIASEDEDRRQDLVRKTHSLGLIKEDGGLEDILTLNTTDLLDRRLQTAVERKGFADTALEARQLVNHGHVEIEGDRVTVPGYLLTQEEEKKVTVELPEPEEEPEEVEEEVEEESETEENEEDEEAEE